MGARKLGRERLETITPAGDEKEIMLVLGKKLRVFSAESGRRPCDQCGRHRHHFLMKPNRHSPVFSGCNHPGPPMMSLCVSSTRRGRTIAFKPLATAAK